MAKLLEVQDLKKEFNLHILSDKYINALTGVSFDLEEGEIIGLTGKSGSGKSTLMKCIYRTYLGTFGSAMYTSAEFGKVDLITADEHVILKLRRTEITYCSQFLSVIPRIPAREIVASALNKKLVSFSDSAIKQAEEVLDRLNLPTALWDAFPSTFSGGEQQRINIARAIVSHPRFLLVDEPTASLDQKTKDAVVDMILELKNEGTSVLCITHDTYTLGRLSDRVYSVENKSFVDNKQTVTQEGV